MCEMKKDDEKVIFPPEMVPVSIINGAFLAQSDVNFSDDFWSFIVSFLVFTALQLALFCVAHGIVSTSIKDGKVKKLVLIFESVIVAVALLFIKNRFF